MKLTIEISSNLAQRLIDDSLLPMDIDAVLRQLKASLSVEYAKSNARRELTPSLIKTEEVLAVSDRRHRLNSSTAA